MNTFKKSAFAIILLLGSFACKTQNIAVQSQTQTVSTDRLKSVDIRGEKLHYVEKGKGEPLIFVHGAISDYRSFLPRVEPYSKGYHAVTYSRRYAWPNKQEFDESLDYSVRIHADDLYAMIKELGLKKVNIVARLYSPDDGPRPS